MRGVTSAPWPISWPGNVIPKPFESKAPTGVAPPTPEVGTPCPPAPPPSRSPGARRTRRRSRRSRRRKRRTSRRRSRRSRRRTPGHRTTSAWVYRYVNVERGAMQKLESQMEKRSRSDQKRSNLVELEKCSKVMVPSVAKTGFDTAESGPSKVWVSGIPVHRYKHCPYRYILSKA